ncbi:MAG: hypothetical protein R3E95_08795 [Thiolinea sp.]
METLAEISGCCDALGLDTVSLLGPIPAPLEKRAGRYRALLLLHSNNRRQLHFALQTLRQEEKHPEQKKACAGQ